MKPSSLAQKSLIGIWVLMTLAPLLTWINRGAGHRFVVSLAVYIAGSALAWAGLRKDPGGAELGRFSRSWLSRIIGICIILAMAMLGFFGLTIDGLLNLLAVILTVFFAIWAGGSTAEALTRGVEKLLLLALSLTVTLVLAEIIFRLTPIVAVTGGNTPGMIRWQLTNYDKVVATKNALSLRSLHLETSKPEGVTRIVTLGDSFTWGDKIARTEDTWPYVVEKILREKGDRAEVINMAHPGFTTVNEAELLHRDGWSFNPNLILLQYNLNDPLPSGPDYFRETESWLYRTRPLAPVFDGFLDDHSYFYSFLNAKFQGLQMAENFATGYAPLYADDFPGWKAAQAALQQMGEEARKNGIPMLLVIFPSFVPGKLDEASYPFLDLHRKVTAAAKEAGFNVFDLRPVYSQFGRPGRTWWALPCDAHPGVEADRVAGQAIEKEIEELNIKL